MPNREDLEEITRREFFGNLALFPIALNYIYKNYSQDEIAKKREELISFHQALKDIQYDIEEEYERKWKIVYLENPMLKRFLKESKIKIRYSTNKELKYCPTIIIIPMMNGETFVERSFAEYYQENGFNPVIVEIYMNYQGSIKRELKEVKDERDLDKAIRKTNLIYEHLILSYMFTIDYLQKEGNNEKIGAIGISLGSLILTSLTGIDERIKATIVGLTGGNLGKIIAHSKERGIMGERKNLLANLGKDEDWLEEKLEGKFIFDPMNMAQYIDPSKMFLILAGNDHIIPTETGIALYKKLPGARLKNLNGLGHLSSILALPKVKKESLEFFKERLS